MAKSTPPDAPPTLLELPKTATSEMTARAVRASERSAASKPPHTEVTTEILDSSALPVDLDDEVVVAKDPRRQLGEEAAPTLEMPRVTQPEPKLPPGPPEKDVRDAERLLQSFMAAAERTKEPAPEPKKEEPKKEEPRKEEPKEAKKPASRPPPELPLPSGAGGTSPRIRMQAGASTASAPPAVAGRGGALSALNQAQPPGVFFSENPRSDGQTEEDDDPELAAAVEEAIGKLFGVRGIHHIGPGKNEDGHRVVVIAASQDFGESSLSQIPETVGSFQTLLSLPFDLLPLRRSR